MGKDYQRDADKPQQVDTSVSFFHVFYYNYAFDIMRM